MGFIRLFGIVHLVPVVTTHETFLKWCINIYLQSVVYSKKLEYKALRSQRNKRSSTTLIVGTSFDPIYHGFAFLFYCENSTENRFCLDMKLNNLMLDCKYACSLKAEQSTKVN